LSLYLEKEIVKFGKEHAASQKTSLNQLVNRWLLELMKKGKIHYIPL